ncbi:unnamed protein product [Sphagnum jensenii]|uniref:Protein LHCP TRANSLOCATION DEFECT n=1 Tax=Sphagnum jensenii TaxID=128206 RepID=A0ABP1AUF3_9BRYO
MAAAAAATPSTAGRSVEGRCRSCCSSSSSSSDLRSSFVLAGGRRRACGASARKQLGLPQGGSSRVTAWFKFGDNGMDAKGAGIYGSQGRDDFDREDVAQYFNYMGMLATEGSYDKMDALLEQGIHAVDALLLLAATEADRPKIQELLEAGARCDVKDLDGKTALDRAADDEIRELILAGAVATASSASV